MGSYSGKISLLLLGGYLGSYFGPLLNQVQNSRTIYLERRGKNTDMREIYDERNPVKILFDAFRTGKEQYHIAQSADIFIKKK